MGVDAKRRIHFEWPYLTDWWSKEQYHIKVQLLRPLKIKPVTLLRLPYFDTKTAHFNATVSR